LTNKQAMIPVDSLAFVSADSDESENEPKSSGDGSPESILNVLLVVGIQII